MRVFKLPKKVCERLLSIMIKLWCSVETKIETFIGLQRKKSQEGRSKVAWGLGISKFSTYQCLQNKHEICWFLCREIILRIRWFGFIKKMVNSLLSHVISIFMNVKTVMVTCQPLLHVTFNLGFEKSCEN